MNILKNKDVRAIAVLIVLWMVFFWRILTPVAADQASFKQGDFSGQFVAFGAYQYERMSQGEIPLWNPYNNGGMPFIGDTQAAVFYPPRLLTIAIVALTSGEWSYHALELEAIFHVLFYSLLMYAFLRRLTGSAWGAFAGAIIAAYGGYISGYPPLQLALLEAAIWLPLGALCIYEAAQHDKIQWIWLVFAGFSLGLSWLAGHPQTSWFLTYLMVVWLAYRLYEQQLGWRNWFFGTGLMGIVSLGITAITFIPSAEYLTMTVRSGLGFEAKNGGFPYQDIAQILFPSGVSAFSPLYVGIPALILIAIAIITQLRKSRFWIGVAIVALLISFGDGSALYHGLYNVLPGLSFFRGQERAAFLIANSLAVLAAIGLPPLIAGLSEKHSQWISRITVILTIFITSITALIFVGWWGNLGDGFGNLVGIAAFSMLMMLFTYLLIVLQLRQPSHHWIILALLAVIVFDLFSVNMDADTNYDPIPPTQQLSMSMPSLVQSAISESAQPYRVDGFRGLQDNYGSLYQIMDIRGISPLFLDNVWNITYRNYVNNPRAWEIFAVRYIFSERNFGFGGVETEVIADGTDRDGQVFVHEITDPRPFAHLVSDLAVVGSDEHAIELLYDPNFPVRDSVILQVEPTLTLPDTAPSDARAEVETFEPENLVVSISTPENAILSLSMVDYSGWSATLNGEPVEILRAYGSLMAFEITAGNHTLELNYNPLSYRIGAIMSAITWLSVIISFVLWLAFGKRTQDQEGS